MSTSIPILCFNDVYRVSQRYVPQPGAPASSSSKEGEGKITVSQFAQVLYDLRDIWDDRPEVLANGDGKSENEGEKEKEGLVLFAGDVFNPSVESSVTRGSHMVSTVSRRIKTSDFDARYPS
jgi:5'-nucleotidase